MSLIDVDAIATATPELEQVAEDRTHDILKKWAHRLSIWGTHGTHGPNGRIDQTFSLRDLAVACYVQGARDSAAVAAATKEKA